MSLVWLAAFIGVPLTVTPFDSVGDERVKDNLLDFLVEDSHLETAKVAKATLGRAVFRSSRQLPDRVVDEIGRYELRGILTRQGAKKATIRDTKKKKTLIKAVGERLDDFEVVEINDGGVRLRRGGEEVELVR